MSAFKCKTCGGTIEIARGASVGVCHSCGAKLTRPHLDNDEKSDSYTENAVNTAWRVTAGKLIAGGKAANKRKNIIAITTAILIVCVCVVSAIVLTKVNIPTSEYNKAVSLLNEGKIIEAYESLVALNGYKDSATKASEIFTQYKREKLKNATVGDIVYFGSYEQDNNTSNGNEDIKWRVLAKEDNKILIISEYALDCQRYNTLYADVTWESCSLRKWLNDTFLNEAFSAVEKSNIQSTIVSADNNPKYKTNPGEATTDKVFLLSITEAEKYFSSNEERKCVPTAYAIAQGANKNSVYAQGGEDTCWWWLRTPGDYESLATHINYDGAVSTYGFNVNYDNFCVRPALWIVLDS